MSGSWIGSLDIHTWALNQMNRELKNHVEASQKKMEMFNKSDKSLTSLQNVYSQLQTMITTFQTSLQDVVTAFSPVYQIASSVPGVATAIPASISGGLTPATHTINVTQLASSEIVASQNFATSAPTNQLNIAETLTLTVGTSSFNVPIYTTNSLQAIAQNINIGAAANNVGVYASVQSTSTGNYQLVISSTQTGTANSVAISENITSGSGLNVSTSGAGGNGTLGTVMTAAADANFTLDNLPTTFVQSSNTNIVIQGMNISLGAIGSTSLVVSATDPVTNVTSAIQDLFTSYNQIDMLIEQTNAQATSPDPTLSLILSQLQSALKITSGSAPYNSLIGIGIGIVPPNPITITDPNENPIQFTPMGQIGFTIVSNISGVITGALAVPGSTIFANALASNFSQVQNLLSGTGGILTQLNKMVMPSSGSVSIALNNADFSIGQEITDVETEIQDEKDRMAKVKKDLVFKYANLEMMLARMQVTSQYVSAQIGANK